ncbi:MAG: hypothetical protein LBF67_06790, partial [Prevotellaceae bacterium]|nr:hypothetical protein [Prevotellaceae bacterium]
MYIIDNEFVAKYIIYANQELITSALQHRRKLHGRLYMATAAPNFAPIGCAELRFAPVPRRGTISIEKGAHPFSTIPRRGTISISQLFNHFISVSCLLIGNTLCITDVFSKELFTFCCKF